MILVWPCRDIRSWVSLRGSSPRAERRLRGSIASAISLCMVSTVASHELRFASSMPRRRARRMGRPQRLFGRRDDFFGGAARCRTMSDHCRTTSRTGVPMIGFPVAMYSSPLVGLMNCVAALIAKHIMFTSNARQ